MTNNNLHSRQGGRFYGWFALVGVMLVIFTMGGLLVHVFGVFLPELTREFQWDRGDVALALSIGILAFGLLSPMYGIIVSRLGPRKVIIFGNFLACIGVGLLSLIQETWQMYLLYAFIGLTAGFGGYVACTTVVANWFVKRRPLALGLFTASGGLGGFAFPPLASALIENLGWEMAWVALACIGLLVGVVLGGIILTRGQPEDKHQLPDGSPPLPYADIETRKAVVPASSSSNGSFIKKIMKYRIIWLIGGFAAANAFALGSMTTHQVAYLQDIGFTRNFASLTLSLMNGMSFIGSVTFGTLAQKIHVRTLAFAGFCLELAALMILINTEQSTAIFIYAALLGLGNGALQTAMPTFVGTLFHGKEYSQAFGIILPFQIVSQAAAGYLAGWIFDTTDSYMIAFYLLTGFIVLGGVLVMLTRTAKAPSSR